MASKAVTVIVHARSRHTCTRAPSEPTASAHWRVGRRVVTVAVEGGHTGRGGATEPIATHALPMRVKPALQVKSHAVPVQVATAFAGAVQGVHDVPQVAGEVLDEQIDPQA
jgi:hypothetical protein